ncbi:hypothetical protein [Sorangium sp. So ce1153]|uniref:hypothetical protein n=1 Tax=Sorangium sp. So ce1153 TaxID=3133333 RepID=UPI003F5F93F1
MKLTSKFALSLVTVLTVAACVGAPDPEDDRDVNGDIESYEETAQALCDHGSGYYCVGNILTWQQKTDSGCDVVAEKVCVLGCVDAGPGRHDYCTEYAGD